MKKSPYDRYIRIQKRIQKRIDYWSGISYTASGGDPDFTTWTPDYPKMRDADARVNALWARFCGMLDRFSPQTLASILIGAQDADDIGTITDIQDIFDGF